MDPLVSVQWETALGSCQEYLVLRQYWTMSPAEDLDSLVRALLMA